MSCGGEPASLRGLRDADGQPFPGFHDAGGAWILLAGRDGVVGDAIPGLAFVLQPS